MRSVTIAALVGLALAGCKAKDKAGATGGDSPGPGPTAAADAAAAAQPVPKPATGEVVSVAPESAPAPSKEALADKGNMRVVYADGDTPVRKAVREEGIFEKLTAGINSKLKLPRDIPVLFNTCGQINAFYDPSTASITMCDEFTAYFVQSIDQHKDKTPEQKRVAIIGAVVFFFLHELGHAMVDQLEIPAVGREEDAADQIATLLLIAGGDEGVMLAAHGADAFLEIMKLRSGAQPAFWDEHSLDEQRFYNVGCLIYGSDPEKYGAIVQAGYLPPERAQRCPAEFKKLRASWDKLLAPYVRE